MDIPAIIGWVKANWLTIIDIWARIIALASVIVAITPTLKDDNFLKGIIKFTGKYLALNTDKGSSPKP
jgi:hypothetical protein